VLDNRRLTEQNKWLAVTEWTNLHSDIQNTEYSCTQEFDPSRARTVKVRFANKFFSQKGKNGFTILLPAFVCVRSKIGKKKSIYESYYLSHTKLLLPGAGHTLVTVYVVYLPRGELQRKATLSHLSIPMKTSCLLALMLVFKFNLFWFSPGSVSVLSH